MAEWLSSSTSDNMPTTNVLCKPDNFAKCTLYSHLPMTSRLVWIQPRIKLSNQNQSIVHKSMIGPYFPPVEGLMSYLRCLCIVVSNTYCVVYILFVFVLCTLCCQFPGLSIFGCHFRIL